MLVFLLTLTDEEYRIHIERLFKRYHKPMLRLASHKFFMKKRSNYQLDAEDAVQGTFEKIVRYAHTVPFDRPEKELRAYVYSILQHQISEILQEPELLCEDITDYADINDAQEFGEKLHISERYDQVVTAIRNMEPRYSTALMLYYCEDMSVNRIAHMLEIPEKTVYSRLRRGKQMLIEMFGEESNTYGK